MSWNYRVSDLKFTGDSSYILWDVKTLKAKDVKEFAESISLPEVEQIEDQFFDTPTPLIPFYTYVLNRCKLPTVDQTESMFWAMYGGSNSTSTHSLGNVDKRIVRARIVEEYAMIVRRFHLYLSLKESGLFDKVSFSIHKYLYNKIQYEISLNGITYWLYVSDEDEEVDANKLPPPLPPNVVTATLTLLNPEKAVKGEVYLYHPEQPQSILQAIKLTEALVTGEDEG